MILKDLTLCLDRIFNKDIAPGWDKTGLQIGNLEKDIKKILVALDVSLEVADEAVKTKSDLVLTHHPLIHDPLDNILSSTTGGKQILKLIENGIASYCAHTNYDAMAGGLNDLIAGKLDLVNTEIIEDRYEQWYKFTVFVPIEVEEEIRKVICSRGGGQWKDYSYCTFNTKGKGTFIPGKGSKPYTGKAGKMSYVDEVRIECIVKETNLDSLINAVAKVHPYEEMAYDIYKIENKFRESGFGRLGELKKPQYFKNLASTIKKTLEIDSFAWMSKNDIKAKDKKIQKVAVASGSSDSLTDRFVDMECDLIIVGEIKYHNALRIAESGKIIITTGHGSSEAPAIAGMSAILEEFLEKEKIKINVIKSKNGYKSWRYQIG
ncbi:MAG: Nif3-like dinuclear metal center hexameric protein [Actinomycetota bacterium]|nr:Nif3-like dinuclear metal center hexameric protein [Actinomycetota bacterium]